MKNLYLESEQSLELETGGTANLSYYLLEKRGADKNDCTFYGIQIEKREGEKVEIETADGISSSREIVCQILHMMAQNKVTPMTMIEVVDDLVTLKLCS